MSRRFRVAYFVHSLSSDWNNGNAHFLRGLLRSLIRLQHDVTIFEATNNWSTTNLRGEASGTQSLKQFTDIYPDLPINFYDASDIEEPARWYDRLADTDIAILHEWNPPSLAHLLLALRGKQKFRVLFHDTHHRASSSPEQVALFGIDRFDGVLAFGESLRNIYRDRFNIERVWTLHEAADTTVFVPGANREKSNDVVWIGNWGEGERSAEIREFLLEPASIMRGQRFSVFGVRYPADGLSALEEAGVHYCGYSPNLNAVAIYAAARLTVHIPRQEYTSAMVGIPTIRVFEALACGIPLISAPWRDTEGLFRECDFLTAPDGEDMQRAMQYLLNDHAAAQAQSARGLETILARHTCEHRAKQLSKIFEELVP